MELQFGTILATFGILLAALMITIICRSGIFVQKLRGKVNESVIWCHLSRFAFQGYLVTLSWNFKVFCVTLYRRVGSYWDVTRQLSTQVMIIEEYATLSF